MDGISNIDTVTKIEQSPVSGQSEVSSASNDICIEIGDLDPECNIPILSEEEEEERLRTPSGTIFTTNVRDISDYFNKASKETDSCEEAQSKAVNSQNRESKTNSAAKKINQPVRPYKRIAKAAERKLKAQAERLIKEKDRTLRRASMITRQNKGDKKRQAKHQQNQQVSTDSGDQSLLDNTDTESDNYLTPSAVPTEDQSERKFLHMLASQLKFATEHQLFPKTMAAMNDIKDRQEDLNTAEIETNASKSQACQENVTQPMQIDEKSNNMENQQEVNVVSIPTVAEMFSRIRADFAELKQEVQSMKAAQGQKVSEEVMQKCKQELEATVNFLLPKENSELEKTKKELQHFKYRNQALTNVVQSMSVELEEIKSRLDNVELNSARCAVSISGLQVDGRKRDIITQLEDFFNDAIGVNVVVEDFIRTGSSQPQFIIAFLQNTQQKRDVLRFKSFLKGNMDYGKPVFVNDYVPATTLEKRRREADIKSAYKAENKEVTYLRGKLAIQGEIYKPRVSVPTPKDIVDLSSTELQQILDLPINQTGKVTQDGSIFEAYTASVNTHQQVRQYYVKLKLMQPLAKHIVCAYLIDGPPYVGYDYCDDGEPAAGRLLADILLKQNMKSRVLFVTRKYGGTKMGSSRFECYKAAAEIVLKAHPYNNHLKVRQEWLLVEKTQGSARSVTDSALGTQQSSDQEGQSWEKHQSEKRPAAAEPSPPQDTRQRQPPHKKQMQQNYYRNNRQSKLNNIRGRAQQSTQRSTFDERRRGQSFQPRYPDYDNYYGDDSYETYRPYRRCSQHGDHEGDRHYRNMDYNDVE